MEVAIVLGSIRQERKSHRLAYYLRDQITGKGAAVNLIDLKNYPLPVFGFELTDQDKKSIEEISVFLKRSQAIVIVTPEHHSNISAALGNVLGYCGIGLIGKVTGIASASATRFGGIHASNNLQITLLNLGAYTVPGRLLVPEIHFAFDQNNEPVHDEIKQQAEKFINQLISYTDSLKDKKAAEIGKHAS